MVSYRAIFLLLTPFAFTILSHATGPTPSPTPFEQFPFLNAYQISDGGRTLDVGQGTEADYAIDISGLYVDLSCARSATISNISSVRIDLLKQGCAKIV